MAGENLILAFYAMMFLNFRGTFIDKLIGETFQTKKIDTAAIVFCVLTLFILLVSFYTPRKNQKTVGILMFSGGIERNQRHEMG